MPEKDRNPFAGRGGKYENQHFMMRVFAILTIKLLDQLTILIRRLK